MCRRVHAHANANANNRFWCAGTRCCSACCHRYEESSPPSNSAATTTRERPTSNMIIVTVQFRARVLQCKEHRSLGPGTLCVWNTTSRPYNDRTDSEYMRWRCVRSTRQALCRRRQRRQRAVYLVSHYAGAATASAHTMGNAGVCRCCSCCVSPCAKSISSDWITILDLLRLAYARGNTPV